MFKPLALLFLVSTSMLSHGAVSRYEELCNSSDLLWCDEENCVLYRSKEIFEREFDMPIGFTITINDDSFTEDELKLYTDDLFGYWDNIMKNNGVGGN